MSLIQSIFSALSGLRASQRRLDVSAHNVANIQTGGFKASRVLQTENPGGGTNISAIDINFNQSGFLMPTQAALDLSIAGDGFFILESSGGSSVFTRNGLFLPNSSGFLVNPEGFPVTPPIQIPPEASGVTVAENGAVTAHFSDGRSQELGSLQIAQFSNPGGLKAIGGNLFEATSASGQPQIGAPGFQGRGRILSGFLEGSNVELLSEIVEQITALRSFQANLLLIRRSDELFEETVNLL